MRMPVSCSECTFVGDGQIDEEKARLIYFVDLSDDGAYLGQCKFGHKIARVMQMPKYEVLFESGAVALLNGFHREAVSSFATALERFFEFSTMALAKHLQVPDDELEKAWKPLSKRSEKQRGAFDFLYLVAFRRHFPFEKVIEKNASVRNEVVHSGKIATRDEAKGYGKMVFDVIKATKVELRELNEEAMRHAQWRESNAARVRARAHLDGTGTKFSPASGALITMLSEMNAGRPLTFEQELESLAERLSLLMPNPPALPAREPTSSGPMPEPT